MGLDITYGNLMDYLRNAYAQFRRPETMAREGERLIKGDIERQVGHQIDIKERAAPTRSRPIRYGSYWTIHVLRLYACRIAGYNVEQTYEFPQRRLTLLIAAVATNEEEEFEEESTDASFEPTVQEEVEEYWHFKLDPVFPLPPREPQFPFSNLVSFSDTEGIYIPVSFPTPVVLDENYVGSCPQLLEELRIIGDDLHYKLGQVNPDSNPQFHDFLRTVNQSLVALRNPCIRACRGKYSMVFG